jgi:hypothetical protein
MSRNELSLLGEHSAHSSIPTCPKCKASMRLTLIAGKDGLDEKVYECLHCHTAELRVNDHTAELRVSGDSQE